MRFLVSSWSPGGIRTTWLLDDAHRHEQPTVDFEFSRCAIGLCFDTPMFGVVVGERILKARDRQDRYYIVLDEYESHLGQDLFKWVIRAKDQFRCETIFCPKSPQQVLESMRLTEGISFYRDNVSPQAAAKLWPSFVDFEMRAALRETETPDQSALHRDLEHFLTTTVINPSTGMEQLGADGQPVNKLQTPNNFNSSKVRAAIRQASDRPCTALWMAVNGLDRSTAWRYDDEEEYVHNADNPTGY